MTIVPSREEFRKATRTANVIPVFAEIVADAETPTSAFQKLDGGGHSFLLESAEQSERAGRFSFLGFHPRVTITCAGTQVTITDGSGTDTREIAGDPLSELESVMCRFRFHAGGELPRFAGGAVGYLGYDVVRAFEPKVPSPVDDQLQLPDMIFSVMQTLVIFDHRFRRVKIVINVFTEGEDDLDALYDRAAKEIADTLAKLATPTRLQPIDARSAVTPADTRSNTTREQFEKNVVVAQEYIRAGDIFQVVLSQRFAAGYAGDTLSLYRALRLVNPSPYLFCLRFAEEFSLIGSSPEMHVRVGDGDVEVRPIAGTRRRGQTPAEDEANAAELLADEKERAEHVMLIDLARNDVGRVAAIGSVRVTEQMTVERYSHVMHLVSHVTARLGAGRTAFDALRATFPAGTVSGAPKIRAMQIIAQLEGTKRGCYAGAVGYFGFDGALDCCIALRSIVLKRGHAYIQAGAGIVADSTAAAEFCETESKAKAMIEAVGRAREISHDPDHR